MYKANQFVDVMLTPIFVVVISLQRIPISWPTHSYLSLQVLSYVRHVTNIMLVYSLVDGTFLWEVCVSF